MSTPQNEYHFDPSQEFPPQKTKSYRAKEEFNINASSAAPRVRISAPAAKETPSASTSTMNDKMKKALKAAYMTAATLAVTSLCVLETAEGFPGTMLSFLTGNYAYTYTYEDSYEQCVYKYNFVSAPDDWADETAHYIYIYPYPHEIYNGEEQINRLTKDSLWAEPQYDEKNKKEELVCNVILTDEISSFDSDAFESGVTYNIGISRNSPLKNAKFPSNVNTYLYTVEKTPLKYDFKDNFSDEETLSDYQQDFDKNKENS